MSREDYESLILMLRAVSESGYEASLYSDVVQSYVEHRRTGVPATQAMWNALYDWDL